MNLNWKDSYSWETPEYLQKKEISSQGKKKEGETKEWLPKRVSIAVDETMTGVFIPDKNGNVIPYRLWEWRFYANNSYYNYETAHPDKTKDWIGNVLKPVLGDLCKIHYVFYLSVYNCIEYMDKKGNAKGPFINAMKLFEPDKNKLKKHHDRRGSLAWNKYDFYRSKKECNASCGDDWQFIEIVNPSTLKKPQYHELSCIDWGKYFRVKSEKELEDTWGHLIPRQKEYFDQGQQQNTVSGDLNSDQSQTYNNKDENFSKTVEQIDY